jgi:hypothetical protein
LAFADTLCILLARVAKPHPILMEELRFQPSG